LRNSSNEFVEVEIYNAQWREGAFVYNDGQLTDIAHVYQLVDDTMIDVTSKASCPVYLPEAKRGWINRDGAVHHEFNLYSFDYNFVSQYAENREWISKKDSSVIVKNDEIFPNERMAIESKETRYTDMDNNTEVRKGLLQLIELTSEQKMLVEEYDKLMQKMKDAHIGIINDLDYERQAFINTEHITTCCDCCFDDREEIYICKESHPSIFKKKIQGAVWNIFGESAVLIDRK
jgi:hypothetical protein